MNAATTMRISMRSLHCLAVLLRHAHNGDPKPPLTLSPAPLYTYDWVEGREDCRARLAGEAPSLPDCTELSSSQLQQHSSHTRCSVVCWHTHSSCSTTNHDDHREVG